MFELATVGKFMEHIQEGETQDCTKNGVCSQCGACCGNVLPLSEKEKLEIHRYIRAHNIQEQKTILPLSIPVYDMMCPFLDRSRSDKKCRIYEVRPAICRAYLCSKTKFDMVADGYLLMERRKATDMRAEFFGMK